MMFHFVTMPICTIRLSELVLYSLPAGALGGVLQLLETCIAEKDNHEIQALTGLYVSCFLEFAIPRLFYQTVGVNAVIIADQSYVDVEKLASSAG